MVINGFWIFFFHFLGNYGLFFKLQFFTWKNGLFRPNLFISNKKNIFYSFFWKLPFLGVKRSFWDKNLVLNKGKYWKIIVYYTKFRGFDRKNPFFAIFIFWKWFNYGFLIWKKRSFIDKFLINKEKIFLPFYFLKITVFTGKNGLLSFWKKIKKSLYIFSKNDFVFLA